MKIAPTPRLVPVALAMHVNAKASQSSAQIHLT